MHLVALHIDPTPNPVLHELLHPQLLFLAQQNIWHFLDLHLRLQRNLIVLFEPLFAKLSFFPFDEQLGVSKQPQVRVFNGRRVHGTLLVSFMNGLRR